MPRTVLLRRALWGGVALGLLFYLGLTLWLSLSAIFFPYQLDYGEGIVLWFTRELAMGHSIYKGIEGLPYASSNYPPLGMALAVPFRILFGDSYVGGRWLNFASALLVTAFIYRIVRTEGSQPAGALGALFFLASTFVYHWIPLFRVDLIGLAFTTAGVLYVWRWQVKNDESQAAHHAVGRAARATPVPWELGLAALFFLAAIYTKHSLVFAPAAAVAAILLRNRRAAIAFALAIGICAAAIFIVFDAQTQGGFAFGLITSNATSWLWSTFFSTMNDFLWTYLVLIAFALWGLVVHLRQKRLGVLETYAFAGVASLVLAGWRGGVGKLLFRGDFWRVRIRRYRACAVGEEERVIRPVVAARSTLSPAWIVLARPRPRDCAETDGCDGGSELASGAAGAWRTRDRDLGGHGSVGDKRQAG